MGKDEFSGAVRVGHGEQDNHDNEHARGRPVDADFVDEIQILCPKRIHCKTDQRPGPKHQNRLPGTRDKIFIVQTNSTQNQLGARKIDRQRHRPIPHQIQPSRNPRGNRSIFFRRHHCTPVIHSTGSRIHGADFGQGSGNGEGDEGDQNPTPDDGDGLAVGESDVEGGG